MIRKRLWFWWHCHLRRFFDRFAPPCGTCAKEMQTMRELAAEGYNPARRWIMNPPGCQHAKYVITSRPWWHLCCNGDSGGWRTRFCDWLERWRFYDD